MIKGTSESTIAKDFIINGNVTGEGELKLAGVISGEIYWRNGKITVEPDGSIEGNVHVNEISISGEVKGTIEAASKVEIFSTGKIKGDVKTARIDIAEGAFLCGNFIVEDKKEHAV
jgi:cytoskeletal protein CcmA (bactofilin family)